MKHSESWERLVEFIATCAEECMVPGVAFGILHDGVAKAAAYGSTSVDNPLDVTENTLFQIGSITKTFTATLIMRLFEMGKLDLDAAVQSYLPDFHVADSEVSSRVTIRHLLTHMGGWDGDFFENTGFGDDALGSYVEAMASLSQSAPLDRVWSYNNSGFALAGHVVATVMDSRFEEVLKELVLEPLGLEHSFLFPFDVMTHRFAAGHIVKGSPRVARPWVLARSITPMGGIISDVADLLSYARFQMGDGTGRDGIPVVSRAVLDAMQRPEVPVFGNRSWGLSWAVEDIGGVRQINHGGATNGQIAFLGIVPERRFAVAVLTNADTGRRLTREVNRWSLNEYLGLEVPRPRPAQAAPDELQEFEGFYRNQFAEAELSVVGGRLVVVLVDRSSLSNEEEDPVPPFSLAVSGPDQLIVLDGPMEENTVEVVRADDGTIGWLRLSGRILARV